MPNPTPPRRRRKETRPAEILDAAMEVFATNGFVGTKLTDIAARAGISHGTIYLYYDSKETLFRALVRTRLVDGLTDRTPPALPADLPARDMLRLALLTAYRELTGSPALALIRILLLESDRFPDLARTCWQDIFGTAEGLLKTFLAEGVTSGALRTSGLQDHPSVLLAPVITAALFAPLRPEPDAEQQAEAQITAFTDALLTGIAADP